MPCAWSLLLEVQGPKHNMKTSLLLLLIHISCKYGAFQYWTAQKHVVSKGKGFWLVVKTERKCELLQRAQNILLVRGRMWVNGSVPSLGELWWAGEDEAFFRCPTAAKAHLRQSGCSPAKPSVSPSRISVCEQSPRDILCSWVDPVHHKYQRFHVRLTLFNCRILITVTQLLPDTKNVPVDPHQCIWLWWVTSVPRYLLHSHKCGVFLPANTQSSGFQSDFSLKKFRLQPLKRDRQSYQLFNKDNSLLGTGMIMKVITNGVLAD